MGSFMSKSSNHHTKVKASTIMITKTWPLTTCLPRVTNSSLWKLILLLILIGLFMFALDSGGPSMGGSRSGGHTRVVRDETHNRSRILTIVMNTFKRHDLMLGE